MRKFKTAIWVIIIAFVAILILQNQGLFMAGHSLNFNLLFADYKTPEIKIVFLCFAFFVAGLLLGAYFILIYHLKTKRKLKALKAGDVSPSEKTVAAEAEPVPTAPTASDVDAKTVVITPEEAKIPVDEKQ